ncbi:MAG: ribosome recycling factor [Candidatus Pacebacteria bacterium]|nr:ribosome recycling factor [Candidatus Paceibacterota bacterium]
MENITTKLKEDLEKNDDYFRDEIVSLNVGRATPSILEDIMVDYYGTPTPLKQVATISAPDARNILIQPWDKGQLKEIEKAINTAQLGFNPMNDGVTIRITIPQPTEERRKDLVKHLHNLLEKAKVSLRNIREEAMKEIKKMEQDKEIGEDERFTKQEEIQKIVDEYGGKLEKETEKKEEEIMTV